MSITTYAELKTAIADYSHRSDLESKIPDFIVLAEARLSDMLLLRNMEVETTITCTVNQNYIALPTGFISPVALWLNISGDRGDELRLVLPEQLDYETSASMPSEYAIDGDNIRLDCPAASAYTMPFRYIKSFALSDSNTTNQLLTKRPDIYLWASLVEVADYASDDENLQKWMARMNAAVSGYRATENRSRAVLLNSDVGLSRRPNILRGY